MSVLTIRTVEGEEPVFPVERRMPTLGEIRVACALASVRAEVRSKPERLDMNIRERQEHLDAIKVPEGGLKLLPMSNA